MISFQVLSFLTILTITLADEYCSKKQPNTFNSLSIQDCQTFHQIYLDVGTPSISYPFLIDTGSLFTWVPTVDCKCGLGIDTKRSSTSKISQKNHSVKYADGDAIFGYQGTQLFAIPNTTLKGVQFPMIFVTKKQAPKIGDRGILALGYDAENIFDLAHKKGQLKTSAFVIDFGNITTKSRILFDKIPLQIIINSIYAPILTDLHLWAIQCKSLIINNINLSQFTTSTLIVDSGTTLTTLNKQLFDQLLKTIFSKCQYLNLTQQIGIICPSSLRVPKIQIKVSGGILNLQPQYYSVKHPTITQVLLARSDITILGSSFFKKYAITFDKLKKRIGFYNSAIKRKLFFPFF